MPFWVNGLSFCLDALRALTVNTSRARSTSLCVLVVCPFMCQLLLGAAGHLLPP